MVHPTSTNFEKKLLKIVPSPIPRKTQQTISKHNQHATNSLISSVQRRLFPNTRSNASIRLQLLSPFKIRWVCLSRINVHTWSSLRLHLRILKIHRVVRTCKHPPVSFWACGEGMVHSHGSFKELHRVLLKSDMKSVLPLMLHGGNLRSWRSVNVQLNLEFLWTSLLDPTSNHGLAASCCEVQHQQLQICICELDLNARTFHVNESRDFKSNWVKS